MELGILDEPLGYGYFNVLEMKALVTCRCSMKLCNILD